MANYISAITGEYVTDEFAAENKDTTVKISRNNKPLVKEVKRLRKENEALTSKTMDRDSALQLAEKLDKQREAGGWYVGRTDIQSFTGNGILEHWAYRAQYAGVNGGESVQFLGDAALEKAIQFCASMNAMHANVMNDFANEQKDGEG